MRAVSQHARGLGRLGLRQALSHYARCWKGGQGGPSGLRLAASAYTTSPVYGTGLGPPSSYSTRSSFDTVSPGAAPLRSRDLQLRGRGDEDSPPPPRELEPRPVVVSMPDLSDESIARRQKVAVALGGLSPLAFISGRSGLPTERVLLLCPSVSQAGVPRSVCVCVCVCGPR